MIIKLHLVADFKSKSDTYFSACIAHILFYLSLLSMTISFTALVSVTVLISAQANPNQNEYKTNITGELL